MSDLYYNKKDIQRLDKSFRTNLINSITGVKPANLIATKAKEGVDNIGIFSSVVHIGSDPALIGFFIRPQLTKVTDTFKNIIDSNYYSINHITSSFYKKAHLTSAKVVGSEFDLLDISKESLNSFHAPFVKASPIKFGMQLLKVVDLPNKCKLIIGEVMVIYALKGLFNDLGELNLEYSDSLGISGLNGYYKLRQIDSLEYS